MVYNPSFIYISVTFLSFDVKEWIIENDLLVHRLKVSIIFYDIILCSQKWKYVSCTINHMIFLILFGINKHCNRVHTSPWNPGKSWNFILAFLEWFFWQVLVNYLEIVLKKFWKTFAEKEYEPWSKFLNY